MGPLTRADQTGVPLLVARLILGGMIAYMGWLKIGDPVDFLKLLEEYEMFPAGWYVVQNVIAVCLPWVETIAGVLLILGVCTRGNALLFMLLLGAFTVIIVQRGMNIHATDGIPYSQIHFDCGCGSGDVLFVRKVPENIILWLFTWVCLLSRSTRFTIDRALFHRPPKGAPSPSGLASR